jgi:hypothetical protein
MLLCVDLFCGRVARGWTGWGQEIVLIVENLPVLARFDLLCGGCDPAAWGLGDSLAIASRTIDREGERSGYSREGAIVQPGANLVGCPRW